MVLTKQFLDTYLKNKKNKDLFLYLRKSLVVIKILIDVSRPKNIYISIY